MERDDGSQKESSEKGRGPQDGSEGRPQEHGPQDRPQEELGEKAQTLAALPPLIGGMDEESRPVAGFFHQREYLAVDSSMTFSMSWSYCSPDSAAARANSLPASR